MMGYFVLKSDRNTDEYGSSWLLCFTCDLVLHVLRVPDAGYIRRLNFVNFVVKLKSENK